MTIEKEVISNFGKKPVTLRFPFEKMRPVENSRGQPTWKIKRCMGCNLCVNVCPSQAIELRGKGRESEIIYYQSKCLFCGECIDVCPTNAIHSISEYETVFPEKDKMRIEYSRSEQNREIKEE